MYDFVTEMSLGQEVFPEGSDWICFYLFLQIDVVTQRGFVPVDEHMRVIDANGCLVSFKILMHMLSFPSDLLLLTSDFK